MFITATDKVRLIEEANKRAEARLADVICELERRGYVVHTSTSFPLRVDGFNVGFRGILYTQRGDVRFPLRAVFWDGTVIHERKRESLVDRIVKEIRERVRVLQQERTFHEVRRSCAEARETKAAAPETAEACRDAAPELLEACRAAEQLIGNLPGTAVNPSRLRVWDQLIAAIAKATGRDAHAIAKAIRRLD